MVRARRSGSAPSGGAAGARGAPSTTATASLWPSPRSSIMSASRRTSWRTPRRLSCLLVRNLGVSGRSARPRVSGRGSGGSICTAPSTPPRCSRSAVVKGMHLAGDYQRFYPSRDLARPIIGGLDPDRIAGRAGLELSLDSHPDRDAGRGGVPQGPSGPPLRLAQQGGARARGRERRRAHARRRAAGDRGAGTR